jgi:hypothetical protein
MNTMILHNEESILFQGDISQTPQYYKRAKGVQSTGTPMSKSESLIKFINKELATNSFGSMLGFPFQIGKNFNSATIADDKKPSAFLSKFKTGFAESRRLYYNALGLKFEEEKLLEDTDTLLEDFKEVNIGDGGSVAHPDFYAAILDLAGNFSEDQRKVHQALMLDARKDAKLYFGEEFAKDINSVLTKEEEVKLKEGFDLMLEGKGQLPLVKFTHRNTMSNTDSVVVPEVMDKFAIFPLYPQFIHDKEVARELFKSMLKEQIGYVKFKSGTKIDTTPPLDIIKMIEDGQVDISFGESKHELQLEYLREQIKTPEKHKKKNTFGTQVRKNILAELGHVKLQNEKNKGDTKRKWEGLIQQFSLATEKEVLGRLGIKAIGEKWDFTSIDKVKVAEILLEEAETKDLPINIRTYFDEYRKNKINNLENAYEYFESSMGSQQIQTLLASIIKKISIQKLNGTQFRQIPVSMFSKKIMSDGKTRDLGFYVLESVISKSDKIIFGHPGIGKTFLRETRDDFIDVDNDYKEEHSTQQILRSHAKNTGKKEDLKAWEDYITTWWSKVKDDAVKSGKQIFVSNLPILRMFPQDFDKVITMSKETFVERAKQRNDYIPGEEGTEGWKNSLDVAIDKIDKSKVITTDKYLSDLLKSRVVPAECKIGMGGDFVNLLNLQDVEDYLSQNKLEDTTMNRLRALNKKLEDESWVEAHKDVLTIASYRIPNQGHNSDEVMVIREFLPPMHAGEIVLPPEVTTQSGTDYDYDKMSAIVPSIGKDGKLITEGVKGIQNEMIKTFADILLDPVNYHKLIVPNSNAIVFDLLKKDLLPKLYKGYDPNAKLRPTEIVTIKRNLRQFKAVKGKDLLGIAAVWNPFTTILQNHDIEIQNFYTKKIGFGLKAKSVQVDVVPKLGNKKVSLFTMDGTNKLEIISQLVNVTVDMPSDDTFGMSALRQDDFGAFIYSISALSYNFKDAMYLFHQPIVLDFKIKVSNKVKSGTKRYKAVTEVLYELFGIPIEKKEDAIDYTKSENQLYSKILGEYEENLNPELLFEDVKPIGEKYEITEQQKAVLAHYIKLLDQASHLRVAQQALNFDTSPDNNLAKARQRKENYKDAVASGIIHKDKINEVMLNSVISGLYVSDIFESLITEMFPVLYSKENKTMFTQLAGNYKQNQEIAFRKAASDFLLAIVQNYGKVNNVNITDVVSPFIEGKYKTLLMKGASDTIEKLKKEGKNYRLLNILTVSIAKDGKKANPQLTLGLENNSDDKNILTEEFRDLLKSEDPKIKSFAEHLAIIGFIQSGWSKSPLYFSDLIPKEFITPIINDAIKSYEGLDETEKKGFLSAFFFNFDYYEGISLGRSKRERHTDSYRLMDWRRGVDERIADFKKEDGTFTKGTKGIGREISSNQDDLEFALTNPVYTSPKGFEWKRDWTEGQSKWREYMINGIDFEGKPYKDVEEAYQKNKDKYPIGQERDAFMQSLLEIKLRTYPKLIEGIDAKGGVNYLTDSTHQPTKKNSHWETGGNNAFIELLTKAYLSVKGIQEQTKVDRITKDDVEKLNKKEAFDKMLSRKKDPETVEDWVATYFETGKVTPKSFDEHLDRNYKTERLNYIDKRGHAIDSIKEIIESDSKREIDINDIIEFIKEYKSVTNYWNAVQEKIKQDLDYYYNQDDTKSNSILKFEKLPPNSVTLGRYEIRDNKAPNSLQYDGRVAPSNMSGSSIGEILQSADTPRIKSYRIANYLLDTLYVSKGWQNSIVQDLANRGVVVKTHLLADDSESPGIMSQQGDIITINVRAIEREIENYGTTGFDTFLTDSLDEELIHLLTVKLASEEDISNIAKELSKEDRQKVTDYYFSKTNDPDETLRDRSIAMEYVRMVVQQKLFNRTTEDSKQVILGLVPTLKKLLNEVLDYLINLFEKNPQSVSTKVINSLIDVIQKESLKDYTVRLEGVKRKANSVIGYGKDNAVKQVFNEYPELEAIGTVQQYSDYLNTIFPDYIDNFAYEAVEELLVANKIIDRKC